VPGEFGTTPYGKYNGPDASYTFCGVKLVGLEDPTNFVLAMDSLEGLNTTESPLESYVGGPFFVAWTWQSGGQVFNAWLAHPINTANAVFADGHAETCDEGRLRSVSNFNLNTANTMGITAYWDTNGVFIY
jgi:prepilin-type processing-associated H-X9-DG protein